MTRFSAPGQAPGDLRQLGNLRRTPGRSPGDGTLETLAESRIGQFRPPRLSKLSPRVGASARFPRRPPQNPESTGERAPIPPATYGDLRNLRRTRSRPQRGKPRPNRKSPTLWPGKHPATGNHSSGDRPRNDLNDLPVLGRTRSQPKNGHRHPRQPPATSDGCGEPIADKDRSAAAATDKRTNPKANGERTANERRTNGARTARRCRTNGARTPSERRTDAERTASERRADPKANGSTNRKQPPARTKNNKATGKKIGQSATGNRPAAPATIPRSVYRRIPRTWGRTFSCTNQNRLGSVYNRIATTGGRPDSYTNRNASKRYTRG